MDYDKPTPDYKFARSLLRAIEACDNLCVADNPPKHSDAHARLSTLERRMLAALDGGPLSIRQLEARLGAPYCTLRINMSKLYTRGVVARTMRGKQAFYEVRR
jgi:hypothetical protein